MKVTSFRVFTRSISSYKDTYDSKASPSFNHGPSLNAR